MLNGRTATSGQLLCNAALILVLIQHAAVQARPGLQPGPAPAASAPAVTPKQAPSSLIAQAGSCPAPAFNVTTAIYITGSEDFAQLASTLPSCLNQAPCRVQIVTSYSCATSLVSSGDSTDNCSTGSQPVFICKGIAVAAELYNAVQNGQCDDSLQRGSVQCPTAELQRSLYNAILSGRCSQGCSQASGPQQQVAVVGASAGQCAHAQLRVGVPSLADALRQKQATLASAIDALNACWANGGRSWQIAALEAPGVPQVQLHAWLHHCNVCMSAPCMPPSLHIEDSQSSGLLLWKVMSEQECQ